MLRCHSGSEDRRDRGGGRGALATVIRDRVLLQEENTSRLHGFVSCLHREKNRLPWCVFHDPQPVSSHNRINSREPTLPHSPMPFYVLHSVTVWKRKKKKKRKKQNKKKQTSLPKIPKSLPSVSHDRKKIGKRVSEADEDKENCSTTNKRRLKKGFDLRRISVVGGRLSSPNLFIYFISKHVQTGLRSLSAFVIN